MKYLENPKHTLLFVAWGYKAKVSVGLKDCICRCVYGAQNVFCCRTWTKESGITVYTDIVSSAYRGKYIPVDEYFSLKLKFAAIWQPWVRILP